ncbi:ABC transporter ATP-binding protein [Streptomyces albipurpureus]|uniref:ABC transporter ATP-binding protein n=1 Tax=Streptomyces albipurpureus TaxID=2897419 RepID=A0ABT0UPV0_9ACTN|nr:ABC transporter ATP-binding protein [Streptomyces sp. CWNU-1]MCM2389635.1 ABC transporter ATP-binding protein [Streptomyces sp. CWNU-1]
MNTPMGILGERAGANPDGTKPAAGSAALALVGLHAGYGQIEVLHGISLSVDPGGVLAVLGANGAGKSTTVRALSGLITPTHGRVVIHGVDVTGAAPDALARLGVCVVPEGRGVFPRLSVEEHLRLISPNRASVREIQNRVYEQFPRLGERRRQLAGTMSGGEQQMLAMARAVALDNRVVVVDELSMGLAPRVVEQLYEHIRTLASTGVAVVVIEQFIHEILGLADHAVVLSQGTVVAEGVPSDIGETLEGLYLAAGPIRSHTDRTQ